MRPVFDAIANRARVACNLADVSFFVQKKALLRYWIARLDGASSSEATATEHLLKYHVPYHDLVALRELDLKPKDSGYSVIKFILIGRQKP